MSSLPGTVSIAEEASLGRRVTGRVAGFVALTKPRIIELLLVTTVPAMIVAARGWPRWSLILATLVGGTLAAGGANAINMFVDRDIDAVMRRTAGRPLPAGRMRPGEALGFGIVLAGGAVLMMALALNWVAAGLLALTIAFYVFVYTMWLKRRTPQNIVIGGAAGAFPPLIGWAAATGGIGWGAIALFAIIFFWTPPHFWALSLYRADDYAKAGVPMLPVVAGPRETKRQMLLYTLVLWPVSLAPTVLGFAGAVYGAAALVLSALFTGLAIRVCRDQGERSARVMFGFSLLYLFLIFSVLLIDHTGSGLVSGGW
jgi:heme o synthase